MGEASEAGGGEQVWVVETNLDDISGELVGYCVTLLAEAGALDVFTTAVQMKKNRPGVTLTVLCHAGDVERLEAIIFRETTTLGVRHGPSAGIRSSGGFIGWLRRGARSTASWRWPPGSRRAFHPSSKPAAAWPPSAACRYGPYSTRPRKRSIQNPLKWHRLPACAPREGTTGMNELSSQVFAEMTTPQMVFLGGLMILVGILLSRSRSYFRRKARESGAAPRSVPAARSRAAHPTENPAEIERWEVEMQELARELSAQARQQDGRARADHPRCGRGHGSFASGGRGSVEAPPQSPAAAPASSTQPMEPAHPAGAFHAAYAPAPNEDPRYRAIYALADQGLSRDVIARRVGTPAGEVDLILSLRGKK